MPRGLLLLVNVTTMVVAIAGMAYGATSATPTTISLRNSDNCVACHTNRDRLQRLAEAKTAGSAETEGEG
jgi:hypothetical protein